MTMDRFNFQRECVQDRLAGDPTGLVLNIGCNADPGGLKSLDEKRVRNCDIRTENPDTGEKYPVDSVFDATTEVWPYEDHSVSLVVLGDIVEHLYPHEFAAVLKETHRVAQSVCITVPEDDRMHSDAGYFERLAKSPKGEYHCYVVTEDYLRSVLETYGFEINRLDVVDYGFVPRGFYVMATRQDLEGLNNDGA
jgi:hypothetical protein